MNNDSPLAKRILHILFAICAGLILVDLFHHKHGHFTFEGWFGFYAIFGFIAYIVIVLSAQQLRKLIQRDEDYYD